MKLRDGHWRFDSRDLMRASCSHCTALSVARELETPGLQQLLDRFYERPDNIAIRYGIRFEEALESELLATLGDDMQKPSSNDPADTLSLMEQGVPVIYQGSLRGGSGGIEFSGRPDFLLRDDYIFEFLDVGLTARKIHEDFSGYTAWDAKLSKTPKVDYQNQVGLYADVLQVLGKCSPRPHGLIQGSREINQFDPEVLIAQMTDARSKLLTSMQKSIDNPPQDLEACGELICTATSYCQICEYPLLCADQRMQHNSLQLVAGVFMSHIESFRAVGVDTVRKLANYKGSTDSLSHDQVAVMAKQAKLQQHFYDTGENTWEVKDSSQLASLPPEDPGDLFFDLEGFTFSEFAGGLEYLFGYVSIDKGEQFHWTWADDRAQEQDSFETFMRFTLDRLEQFPNMRIYHYANYEQSALKRLAKRFGSYEQQVDSLLANEVFVDLYKIVKASLIISQDGYSIKKLENFYSFDRSSDVKEAMSSLEYYDQYLTALAGDPAQAEMLKRQVLSYNQDDCVSTLALCRWLRTL